MRHTAEASRHTYFIVQDAVEAQDFRLRTGMNNKNRTQRDRRSVQRIAIIFGWLLRQQVSNGHCKPGKQRPQAARPPGGSTSAPDAGSSESAAAHGQ